MTKSLVLSFIKNSDKIKTTVISGNFDNPIAGTKWELKVEGEFKNMQNNDGFSKKQLEQLQELLRPIQQDIEILKSFHKDKLKQE